MTHRLPVRVGLGVGLLAGSVLALQVLLTRLFSAALFYHLSLPFDFAWPPRRGSGAIAVYVRPAWFERRPLERELALWSVVLALLLMVVLARLDFGTSDQVTLRFAGLLALLLWSGLGSLLAGRARDPRRVLTIALTVSCVVIAASAFGLLPLLAALIDLPFSVRVALTALLLAPAGIPLGMAMPLGLGRRAELHPQGVAWAWGVNGWRRSWPRPGRSRWPSSPDSRRRPWWRWLATPARSRTSFSVSGRNGPAPTAAAGERRVSRR